jgi:ryanodine receptor 3
MILYDSCGSGLSIGVLCFSSQKYDLDLFRMALPCLSAIAGALPPDYLDTRITATLEKQVSVDADGNFDPKPINTMK